MYMNITNKPNADLVLIGKILFKKVNLYKPSIHNFYKRNGNYVIFQNFKGTIPKDLINIANKLLKNDPTSSNFNIKDKKLRKKYNISKKIPKNWKYKYITQFLNIPITNKQYDFIRHYNQQEEIKKMQILNEITYNLNNNIIPDNKDKQLIHSILYAKKYKLEIIPIDKGQFNSELGKLILKNLYKKHEPILINLNSSKKVHKEFKLNFNSELKIFKNKLFIEKNILKLRNISLFNLRYNKVLFYQTECKVKIKNINEYIQSKYTKYPITNSWLSLQEIFKTFPDLIPKKNKKFKVFLVNENMGSDIKAICYYINKNKISNKCFEWTAQSFNQVLYNTNKDIYNLYKKYPEKWDFGPSDIGDITKFKYIEYYKKKCKYIKLLLASGNEESKIKNFRSKHIKLAEIIFMFNNLPKHGNFILLFSIKNVYPLFINLFYLMFKSFKKFYFYKSLESLYSDQFYIIGINYTPIKETYLMKMKNILNKYDNKRLDEKIIKEKYQVDFIYKLYNSFELFINNYIYNINKQLYYLDNAKYIPKEHFSELKKINNRNNEIWVNRFL